MVFGMAQRHGGELEIDSELGRGTTMRLIFPRAPNGMTVREQQLATPVRSLRILLIDDDPLLLKSLRDALELDEHEVVTAEGGQTGIDTFAAAVKDGTAFDVVITDLGMPYVDGRKVATRVRQLSAQVPIIMLTGWGHRLTATDDKPDHVDKVLSKPPKMVELRVALAELVRGGKSEVIARPGITRDTHRFLPSVAFWVRRTEHAARATTLFLVDGFVAVKNRGTTLGGSLPCAQ